MTSAPQAIDGDGKIRLDKWLWHARFFKTRALAAALVKGGHMRVNGVRSAKASHTVRAGDVLTFPQARAVRIVRIVALGQRRGPAPEAQALYEDLAPTRQGEDETSVSPNPRYEGKGRPTKRDRRKLDLNAARTLE